MEFLVITGLSGAGKTRVIDICEDMGYYCVDNLPIALIDRFAELCLATRGRFERVAVGLDVRASRVTEGMKLAAARAIAGLVSDEELNADYILPAAFDSRLCGAVAAAVAQAARQDGVARI